jgi:hypothetical protein
MDTAANPYASFELAGSGSHGPWFEHVYATPVAGRPDSHALATLMSVRGVPSRAQVRTGPLMSWDAGTLPFHCAEFQVHGHRKKS